MLEPSIATLCIGIVIGYVGQRSRMCFVGGLRDFLLVRDTDLLRGLLAFFVTAWLAFSIAGFLGLLGGTAPSLGATGPITGDAGSSSARRIISSRTAPLPSHAIGPQWVPIAARWPTMASAAIITSAPVKDPARAPVLLARARSASRSGPLDWITAWFQSLPYSGSYLTLTVLAAFGLGLLSVLANGCPFRQHVMAAQGISGAAYYLLGFYGGILVYDRFVVHWLFRLL